MTDPDIDCLVDKITFDIDGEYNLEFETLSSSENEVEEEEPEPQKEVGPTMTEIFELQKAAAIQNLHQGKQFLKKRQKELKILHKQKVKFAVSDEENDNQIPGAQKKTSEAEPINEPEKPLTKRKRSRKPESPRKRPVQVEDLSPIKSETEEEGQPSNDISSVADVPGTKNPKKRKRSVSKGDEICNQDNKSNYQNKELVAKKLKTTLESDDDVKLEIVSLSENIDLKPSDAEKSESKAVKSKKQKASKPTQSKSIANVSGKKRFQRCGICVPCKTKDSCGECQMCLHKNWKKPCIKRECIEKVLHALSRGKAKSLPEPDPVNDCPEPKKEPQQKKKKPKPANKNVKSDPDKEQSSSNPIVHVKPIIPCSDTLTFGGFVYNRQNSQDDDRVTWHCSVANCPGQLTTNRQEDDLIVDEGHDHKDYTSRAEVKDENQRTETSSGKKQGLTKGHENASRDQHQPSNTHKITSESQVAAPVRTINCDICGAELVNKDLLIDHLYEHYSRQMSSTSTETQPEVNGDKTPSTNGDKSPVDEGKKLLVHKFKRRGVSDSPALGLRDNSSYQSPKKHVLSEEKSPKTPGKGKKVNLYFEGSSSEDDNRQQEQRKKYLQQQICDNVKLNCPYCRQVCKSQPGLKAHLLIYHPNKDSTAVSLPSSAQPKSLSQVPSLARLQSKNCKTNEKKLAFPNRKTKVSETSAGGKVGEHSVVRIGKDGVKVNLLEQQKKRVILESGCKASELSPPPNHWMKTPSKWLERSRSNTNSPTGLNASPEGGDTGKSHTEGEIVKIKIIGQSRETVSPPAVEEVGLVEQSKKGTGIENSEAVPAEGGVVTVEDGDGEIRLYVE